MCRRLVIPPCSSQRKSCVELSHTSRSAKLIASVSHILSRLASILVSRFILDLRQDGEEQGDDDLQVLEFSNIDFAGAQDPGDVEDSTIRDG